MATITKPMALDESFNTTETTPRSQADVLAAIESAIRQGFGQVASAVEYDNTDSGLTAENVQDAIDEVDDAVDGLVDDVAEITSDIESTKSISGNPITLTDAAPIYAESLVVELESIQDLHGYDFPWVGGAGKNLLSVGGRIDVTVADVIYTSDDEYLYLNGTKYGVGYANLASLTITLQPGTYYIKALPISGSASNTVSVYPFDGSANLTENIMDEEKTLTLETESTFYFRFAIWADGTVLNNYKVGIVISKTQNIDRFYPYSNICPITGYTECEVESVGKNLFDADNGQNGYINDNGTITNDASQWATPYFELKGYSKITASAKETMRNFGFAFFDENKNIVLPRYDNYDTSQVTQTIPNNVVYARVWCKKASEVSMNASVAKSLEVQYEFGESKTTYEPYHSSNATIQFGQTVYGGSVDFLTGVLTVDRALEVFDGSNDEDWLGRNDNKSRTTSKLQGIIKNASSDGVAVNFLKSNMFKKGSADEGWGGDPNIIGVGTDGLVYTSTGETMSISDWRAYLESNQLQVCYELAAPFTIQLTPDELKLLKGTNNITTNGTTINLGYIPNNSIGDAVRASEEYTDRRFREQPVSILFDVNDTPSEFVPLALDQAYHYYEVVSDDLDKYRFFTAEIVDRMAGRTQYVRCGCTGFLDDVVNSPNSVQFRLYVNSQTDADFAFYKDSETGKYMVHYHTDNDGISAYMTLRIRMYN